MIIWYPIELKVGTKFDLLLQNLDFSPKLMANAGVKVLEEMQDESFRNIVSGDLDDRRDAVYYIQY